MGKSEVLSETRQLFATTHWTTGQYSATKWEDGGGRKRVFCAIGGLRHSAGYDDAEGDTDELVWSVVDRALEPDFDFVAYREALHDLVSVLALNDALPGVQQDAKRVLRMYGAGMLLSQDLSTAAEALEEYEAVVVNWNDEPGRTLGDVLAMFDRALLGPSGQPA